MAEQTQTEKLEQRLKDIIAKYHNQVPFMDEVPEILQACKEAGLVFSPTCEGCPDKKEDGYGLVCIITCSKAFRRIEI